LTDRRSAPPAAVFREIAHKLLEHAGFSRALADTIFARHHIWYVAPHICAYQRTI
jgi:hypothetical protein